MTSACQELLPSPGKLSLHPKKSPVKPSASHHGLHLTVCSVLLANSMPCRHGGTGALIPFCPALVAGKP